MFFSSHPKKILTIVTLALVFVFVGVSFGDARPVSAQPPLGEVLRPSLPPASCTDMWRCVLPREIGYTDRFLQWNEFGQPATSETRPLSPEAELLRLNELSQAMGYLNLYRATPTPYYRQEAFDRVNYLYNLGPSRYGNGVRTGVFGAMFLEAWLTMGDSRFRVEGLRIADDCLRQPENDLSMNGGLMCAMNLDMAYGITNEIRYRDAARAVVQRTAPKQFTDGAFPHLPSQAAGESLGYTAWKMMEMLWLYQYDPTDPNLDLLMTKSGTFLTQRIGLNGSLVYQDEHGSYDQDAGGQFTRYWVNDIPAVALGAYATGRPTEAASALRFLFTKRLKGESMGGYPDKYGDIDPTNIWMTGRPSITRTSLVFWYLTSFQKYSARCPQGQQVRCVVTPDNCNPALAALGLCTQNLPGVQSCIAGRYTTCFNPDTTGYKTQQACFVDTYCSEESGSACMYSCTHRGTKLCSGSVCADTCYDIDDQAQGEPLCDVFCFEGQSCAATRRVDPEPVGFCPAAPPGLWYD